MENYLIYPTKNMYITQSYVDTYSHSDNYNGNPRDYPIDESCGNKNREYFYCPCDEVVVKRIYGVGNNGTNAIWFESTSEVVLANNKRSYVTIMVIHPNDDTLKSIKVGDRFLRKEKMFLEGNDGYATGNHFHISISASKYISSGWTLNNKNAWVIKGNSIKPEDAFWVDSSFTKILSSKGLKFKTMPNVILNSVKKDSFFDQIEVVGQVSVFDSINGDLAGYLNNGYCNVLEIEKIDNVIWYKVSDDMWIVDDDNVIFYFKVQDEIKKDEIKNKTFFDKIKYFFSNLIKKILDLLMN